MSENAVIFLFFALSCIAANSTPSAEFPTDALVLLQTGSNVHARKRSRQSERGMTNSSSEFNPAQFFWESIVGGSHPEGHPAQTNSNEPSCAALQNHGAYFSVDVQVGTPPQRFAAVADTGSDAVIVPSCVCQEAGECAKTDSCFRGQGVSSTFHIKQENIGLISMEFGSGMIEAAIASDIVKVGAVSGYMEGGLLLMVGRQLDISGSFEGILGLGQLQADAPNNKDAHEGKYGSWDAPQERDPHSKEPPQIPGFLRTAGVNRFSICFDDGPGVLRLNTPSVANAVPSFGAMHWGLSFLGMGVGDAKVPALFCKNGNDACGGIPDSGTTVMLGPMEHVRALFVGICDAWPRCRAVAKQSSMYKKEEIFQILLNNCQDWMGEGGAEELPDIYLHFGGKNAGETIVGLSGWSYIFETPAEEAGKHARLLGGLASQQVLEMQEQTILRSSNKYVCAPAFGATDIELGSSPLWILGTPLFYEYIVSFDLSTAPPSIGFSTEACGSCGKETVSLMAKNRTVDDEDGHAYLHHRGHRPQLRRIHGPLRVNKHPKQFVHNMHNKK